MRHLRQAGSLFVIVAMLGAGGGAMPARAQADGEVTHVEAGRVLSKNRDARISVEGGAIVEMQGFVNEIQRAFYDATGDTYKQNPEGYDLSDFQIDDGYAVLGISFEKAWKYFAFEGRVLGMDPKTEATARRNYYLSVGDVSFNGQSYDYIKIPEGTPFTAEFVGALFELNALVTPVTFWISQNSRFAPWIGVGVYGLAGTYDLDAGPATGTTIYQNPPETFVVGGHADGSIVGALPELVIGGELVYGEDDATQLLLQTYFGVFTYSGASGYFTSKDQRYDKHADIDHWHLRVRGAFDMPLKSGFVLTAGLQLDMVDTQATFTQTATTREEIIARRERYDKEGEVKMTILTGFVGLAF
ncbi:MAG: hypothetical protein O3B24_02015 [Verrucomicrobia bacterium]|nr:hypothetical protein [Verrucomicrobiota bacterium]